jgi:hypothetical protein
VNKGKFYAGNLWPEIVREVQNCYGDRMSPFGSITENDGLTVFQFNVGTFRVNNVPPDSAIRIKTAFLSRYESSSVELKEKVLAAIHDAVSTMLLEVGEEHPKYAGHPSNVVVDFTEGNLYSIL